VKEEDVNRQRAKGQFNRRISLELSSYDRVKRKGEGREVDRRRGALPNGGDIKKKNGPTLREIRVQATGGRAKVHSMFGRKDDLSQGGSVNRRHLSMIEKRPRNPKRKKWERDRRLIWMRRGGSILPQKTSQNGPLVKTP